MTRGQILTCAAVPNPDIRPILWSERPARLRSSHLDSSSWGHRPPRSPPLGHLMRQPLGGRLPPPLPLAAATRTVLGCKEVNDLNKRNFFVLCKSQHMICY